MFLYCFAGRFCWSHRRERCHHSRADCSHGPADGPKQELQRYLRSQGTQH